MATLLAYTPVLVCGYIWDDNDYVYDNRNLRTIDGIINIWMNPRSNPQYYPLVFTTYWLEYRAWGLWATGYHVVNVVLHATSALLIWRILERLTVPGAWFAAALFALHPVHVESVAWITERKNTLSLVFYLASAACFLRAVCPAADAEYPKSTRTWSILYGLALGFYVAALLSKTVAVTLPAALLVVLWWKHGRLQARDVYAVLPMFLVGIPLGLLTVWMERHHVKAVGPEWDFSAMDRILIAGRALWFYAGKLLFPSPLIFIYPRWQIEDHNWRQYLYPATAAGVLVLLYAQRHYWGRGPFACAALFAGSLFPALGFFNVYPMRYSFVADHFQYLASIAPIAGIAALTSTYAARHWSARLSTLLGTGSLAVLALLTWCQCWSYLNIETLWRDTLAKNPACEMAHTNLGLELCAQGRASEALPHFEAALKLNPADAVTHNNIALALSELQRHAEAEKHLRRALAILPQYAVAASNLAVTLQRLGREEDSEQQHRIAVSLGSSSPAPWYNYGSYLQERGRLVQAKGAYAQALELDPDHVLARYNLALLMVDEGDSKGARGHLQRILAAEPQFTAARELVEQMESPDGR